MDRGVKIPHEKGALGHSDADVLLHAVCDALLGAVALGDIGAHFPDNAAEFKDIDSKILLGRSYALIKEKGYAVVNIDSTIMLEQPRIRPYSDEMRKIIASLLEITPEDVSIKATTNEKMGFIGRQEGLSAYATALLRTA